MAAVVSTSALANTVVDKGFTFSLGGGYTAFDSERSLDNNWGPEIGIGYRFNDRMSLEGIYSQFKTDQKNAGEAKIKNYRLDGFYDLRPWDGDWTPYALVGIGELRENREFTRDREDTRMSFGGGVRKALMPNLSLRGDIRAIRSLDYGQTEGMVNVALTWTFGSPAKPVQQTEPAPPPPPVQEEEVVQPVAPPDSDMDGVVDSQDLCPNTPAGSTVDATGCIPMEEIDLLVEFGFDSDTLRDGDMSTVEKMADFMKRHPEVRIVVEGHTDSKGPAAYNEKLSQQRAEVVRQILVQEHGIDQSRIDVIGKGESEPVADNSTMEGRQKNRRVVAEVLK